MKKPKGEFFYFLVIGFLLLFSILVLGSVAPQLFPAYLLYIILALAVFVFFLQLDFEVISLFANFFYIGSIIFLILPLILGEVTRGVIRWVPVGPLSFQPAEIVRPFLLVFFAVFMTRKPINPRRLIYAVLLFALPFLLIAVQPSLGVAVLTAIGFFGILIAAGTPKKYFAAAALASLVLLPLIWQFLAPYQRGRISAFLEPAKNPLTEGYNSIQSMIAVGSGKEFGRGLGRGIQTQLAFLPEKHTDFVFAAISEEMGFAGSLVVTAALFFLLYKLTDFIGNARDFASRAYLTGLFFTLLVQIAIHIGMNSGLLPITGVPLPLVSGGGSSLLATMIGLSVAHGAKKR